MVPHFRFLFFFQNSGVFLGGLLFVLRIGQTRWLFFTSPEIRFLISARWYYILYTLLEPRAPIQF